MKKLVIISSFLFLIMQMNCIKKDFTPTIANVNDEQYLKMVNTTIAELRSWLPTGSTIYKIPDEANWVIQGVIVSSDVNSNFYKCIHIQDSTAGIQLMVDGSGLYASYPVGMRVFVKLAGLGLTTYNNQLELGLVDNTTQKVINIPVKLLDNYIVKGSLNHGVDTLKISDISSLSSIYQSRLVKLSNVIIDTSYAGKKTMGDVVSQSSSYTIPVQDSRKNTVVLSTSPYAIFANQLAPQGAGYIVAVATQYGTNMQLVIRGMQDIHFNTKDTLIPNAAIPENWKIIKISEVRSWKGSIARLPMVGDTAIRGIVVSDNSFVNMPDSQLFIQDPDDNNRAICIFLNKKAADIKFKHGDEIVVNLKGAVLISQNAGKVTASFAAHHGASVKDPNIVIVGSNKPVYPVSVSLDDLITDLGTENPVHEAQLVKVENGYFGTRQGQTFSGNIYLSQKDNNQQLTCYTKPAYTGGNLVPNGLCNVTTLVAKYYGGYEFIFRMPTDIEDLHIDPPAVVNPPGCALYEDFDVRTGGSYAGSTAVLNSGTWFIAGYASMTEGSDRYEGTKSIRLRGNSSDVAIGGNMIQMNFDKPDGIGTVKFKYGSYSTHSGGKIFVEYSTDEGSNWTRSTTSFTSPAWGGSMIDAEVPINISGSVRIRIKKDVQGGSTSLNIDNICIGDYVPTAVMPTFSPVAGTYESPQNITITTTTPSADIYYTTDGNTPTISSTKYTTPFALTATTGNQTIVVKAIAVASGMVSSTVASAEYTITPPGVVADPVYSPVAGTYTTAQSVTITCATEGADIYYTTDGNLPTSASTHYTGTAISIPQNTTLKAIAIKGAVSSNVASADYKIKVPTPTFTPSAGTYTTAQSVTMSAMGSATIYYTDDGTTPTTSSQMYSSPINVSSTTTLKAIAVKAGMENSDVASAIYTINAGGGGTQTITWILDTLTSPNTFNNPPTGSKNSVNLPINADNISTISGATLSIAGVTSPPANVSYTGSNKTAYTSNWAMGTTSNPATTITGQYWIFSIPNVTATSSVAFSFGSYGTGTAPANWNMEYSIDNGSSWQGTTGYVLTTTSSTFNKTWLLSTPIINKTLLIRLIPDVTKIDANGKILSITLSSGNGNTQTGGNKRLSNVTITIN